LSPKLYGTTREGIREAEADSVQHLERLPWDKAVDFVERLYGKLAKDVGYRDRDSDDWIVTTPLKEVQAHISKEIQHIFLEERLGLEFRDGMVHRRGRKHSVDLVGRATVAMGDRRLDGARKHYAKAVGFFRHATKPDYENAVKEAVCAVEAAGKSLFPDAKASTLGDLVKWLVAEDVKLPKTLGQTISALYGFRSGGEGVGHGGATGGEVTAYVAEYILAVSASQIIYLVDLADAQGADIPF